MNGWQVVYRGHHAGIETLYFLSLCHRNAYVSNGPPFKLWQCTKFHLLIFSISRRCFVNYLSFCHTFLPNIDLNNILKGMKVNEIIKEFLRSVCYYQPYRYLWYHVKSKQWIISNSIQETEIRTLVSNDKLEELDFVLLIKPVSQCHACFIY